MREYTQDDLAQLGEGIHGVGKQLYHRVRGGARSWLFRYQMPGQPTRTLTLGSADKLSLDDARTQAEGMRELLASGIDPKSVREGPAPPPPPIPRPPDLVRLRSALRELLTWLDSVADQPIDANLHVSTMTETVTTATKGTVATETPPKQKRRPPRGRPLAQIGDVEQWLDTMAPGTLPLETVSDAPAAPPSSEPVSPTPRRMVRRIKRTILDAAAEVPVELPSVAHLQWTHKGNSKTTATAEAQAALGRINTLEAYRRHGVQVVDRALASAEVKYNRRSGYVWIDVAHLETWLAANGPVP